MSSESEEQKRPSLVTELMFLSTQMKQYESDCPDKLDDKKWTLLRVDGHCFHTFTKKFKNLHDPRISQAMICAASDWLKHMNGRVVYVQSDEAALVIAPSEEKGNLPFSGRVQKIVTLSSAFFTVRFNRNLPQEFQGTAHFDCRAFQVEAEEQVRDMIFRNGISVLSRMMLATQKEVKKESTIGAKLQLIKSLPEMDAYKNGHIVHGTFCKMRSFLHTNEDGVSTTRKEVWSSVMSDQFVIVTPPIEFLITKCLDCVT